MAPLIAFYHGQPTDYVLEYRQGRVRRAGPGLAFFYWVPTTSLAAVPLSTADVPFILNETTGNFQAVTVQGQLTYRVADPRTLASILNFTIDPATRAYRSDDPEKLAGRIVNVLQAHLRAELSQLALDEALRRSAAIAGAVRAR